MSFESGFGGPRLPTGISSISEKKSGKLSLFFFFVVVFVTGWLLQLNSTGGGEFTVLGVVLGRILSAQLCK